MLPMPAVQAKPLADVSRSLARWVSSFEPFRRPRNV